MLYKNILKDNGMLHIPDDIINHFAGIATGSPLDILRGERPAAKENAQLGFLALFAPEDAGGVSLAERHALAVFFMCLHGARDLAAFYAEGLIAHGAPEDLQAAVIEAAGANAASGPYGAYPPGPLSAEDAPGPSCALADAVAKRLGRRLAAAVEHAHMLVFHPRDSSAASLQKLLDAGWTPPGIVTVSQLVAFLAYQIRLIHGLRAMAAADSNGGAA